MGSDRKEWTTIAVRRGTKERFDRAKPFDSMSANEFVDVLVDRWDGVE